MANRPCDKTRRTTIITTDRGDWRWSVVDADGQVLAVIRIPRPAG